MRLQEIIGYLAGALGVYVAVPQARNIRRLGHGNGVSLVYWCIMLAVGGSWFAYGIIIDSPSLAISNVFGFTTSAMVVTALLDRGWWLWPVLYLCGAIWALGFSLLPLSVITVLLVVATFSRLPQILRSLRSLRLGVASAVSMRSQYLGLTAMLLWLVYSALSQKESLMITTMSGLTMTLVVIGLELATRRKAAVLLKAGE